MADTIHYENVFDYVFNLLWIYILTTEYRNRLKFFQSSANCGVLNRICHGIERESLRVTPDARIATTPHPVDLGSSLTHPYITTDFSEALLEFITPVHCRINDTLGFLEQLHQYTCQCIDHELLWAGSMPPLLEGDDSIPIAQYGCSNIGVMKTVYREGLWHRYGKPMQTIAGIHYNVSFPFEFWHILQESSENKEDDSKTFRSSGYFSLIRNFLRYSWLLIYLFGASPVVNRSFFDPGDNQHNLQILDDDSLFLPHATSLRMSDMGYSNNAQSSLNICYNSLEEYVYSLSKAIRTNYPPYEAIGLKRKGQYLQLNTNLLQIENEYYSAVRPKRIARYGEKPVTALRNEGVEYVEVRCLDLNPFEPLGMSEMDYHFLDVFLVYCALQDNRAILSGESEEFSNNFKIAVMEGRRPGVKLNQGGKAVLLQQWGLNLLEDMSEIASILDDANQSSRFRESLSIQQQKLEEVSLTPSARLLNFLEHNRMSYIELMISLSEQHSKEFSENNLGGERVSYFKQIAQRSLADQRTKENEDTKDFDEFIQAYMASE